MKIYSKVAKLKRNAKDILDIFSVRCFFCSEAVDDPYEICIHHLNHDHNDNNRINKVICHSSCHKAYHARVKFSKKPLEILLNTKIFYYNDLSDNQFVVKDTVGGILEQLGLKLNKRNISEM